MGRPRLTADSAEQGSKSLRRALALLRAVAEREPEGARLAEISEATGIHTATAHRLLRALEDEGMIAVGPESRTYNLGAEIIKMSAAAKHVAISGLFHHAIEEIAKLAGDNTELAVPAGYDGLIAGSVGGSSSLRLAASEIGTRRPLGVGAGNIALLAAYPSDMSRRIYEANLQRYEGFSWTSAEQIWEETLATRRRGYTVVKGHLVAEATAVAVPMINDQGMPIAAISVTAVNSRMFPERRTEIAKIIRSVAAKYQALPYSSSQVLRSDIS